MLRCQDRPPPAMTSTTKYLKPATRRWTYADYCRIPADGKRHEILDGRHFVNPAPSPYHQFVSGALYAQLRTAIQDRGRGLVLSSPIDVHLASGTIVQPDIVVVLGRTRPVAGATKLRVVPDLLVEVLSPSTRRHDQQRKRERYERAGVREYWLVDPEACHITQLVLRKGAYVAVASDPAQLTLRICRCITLDLDGVW